MIEAVVTFKDGFSRTLWADTFDELFDRMKRYKNIARFNAYKINAQSLRQGQY